MVRAYHQYSSNWAEFRLILAVIFQHGSGKKLEVIRVPTNTTRHTMWSRTVYKAWVKGRNEEFKEFDVELRLLRCDVLHVREKIPHALYIQELHKFSRFYLQIYALVVGGREKSGGDPSRLPHILWPKGQRVLCLLNFPHTYDMQAGTLVENKGFLFLLIFPCMLMREN